MSTSLKEGKDETVMSILLNDLTQEDYATSGGMVYLTPDGSIETPSGMGNGSIHKDAIPHATAPFIGTRYNLVLYRNDVGRV